ncbi:MAG: NAD(P)-binding domain-containing protein, partial [Nitrososphaeraceae archaeon]
MDEQKNSVIISCSYSQDSPTSVPRNGQIQDRESQSDFDSTISFNKILVIGLGQLGLPVAKYVKDRGFDVYGYDISTKALERAEKTA